MLVFAATEGYLDALEVAQIHAFEQGLYTVFDARYADLLAEIRDKKEISDALRGKLKAALDDYQKSFLAEHSKGAAPAATAAPAA
ncbi:MAG: hypothetical protein ACYDC3_09230 [Candidatus Binataceae bacterium]